MSGGVEDGKDGGIDGTRESKSSREMSTLVQMKAGNQCFHFTLHVHLFVYSTLKLCETSENKTTQKKSFCCESVKSTFTLKIREKTKPLGKSKNNRLIVSV